MKLLGRRRSAGTDELLTCGCCARELPRTAVHELGGTPGVYVCRRCAAWMATRIGRK
ncbi:hypothetical protein [Blastococcus sp. TF02A-30]|uniref:hypothetical protein n=1 Tax=Blastococcus sp. TF02A-30 TaxID=2250580 RepID=UPI0013144BFF|nr:hypothetical protein [Blastococcus sp. TF02A-30]